jgi:hypothetical protein
MTTVKLQSFAKSEGGADVFRLVIPQEIVELRRLYKGQNIEVVLRNNIIELHPQ